MLGCASYRHVRLLRVLSLAVLAGLSVPAVAQQDSVLSKGESRMLSALIERFVPVPSVDRIWTGCICGCSNQI